MMFFHPLHWVFILLTIFSTNGLPQRLIKSNEGCSLRLNVDINKKTEPLLLVVPQGNDTFQLAIPERINTYDIVSLLPNQVLAFACTGNNNYLVVSSSGFAEAVCKQQNILSVQGQNYESSQLYCKQKVTPSIRNTGKPCARGKGTILHLGFDAQGWHTIVETCHDIKGFFTYYSKHKLHGPLINGKVRDPFRPDFRRGGDDFYKGINPRNAYNVTNQQKVIFQIVGDKVDRFIRVNDSLFMARGHLAPNADFLFGAWQHGTFFYVNVAPQWQSINGGNWMALEKAIRTLGSKLNTDLDVATGTEGVMELPDETGIQRKVYLSGSEKLPAPRHYWKVVHNPEEDSCMAILCTNNPFLDTKPMTVCPDICRNFNWPTFAPNMTLGFIYCCSYSDFKKAVPYAPNFNCKSILAYPNNN